MKNKPEKKTDNRIWDYKKWEKIRTLSGVLQGVYFNVGQFKSTIIHIREEKSEKVQSIWGYAKILEVIRPLPAGSYVKINYLGKRKTGKSNAQGKPKYGFDYDIWYGEEKNKMKKYIFATEKKSMGKLGTGGRKSK
jgi:hypothetical protein